MAYDKNNIRYPSTIDPIVDWVLSIQTEEAAQAAFDEFKERARKRWPEESQDSPTHPTKFACLRLQGTVRDLERMVPKAERIGAPPTAVKMLRGLLKLAGMALEVAPTLDGRPRPGRAPEPASWAKSIRDEEQQGTAAAAAEVPRLITDYDALLG